MYYVYVLKSIKYSTLYIGCTNNLRRRFEEHNSKDSKFTSQRGLWKLVYYEAYKSKIDAMQREKMLKSYGSSWHHLKSRIKISITEA